MLAARLSDIKLVGTLEKKRDHFVVICIDGEEVATSERKNGIGPLRWEEEHTLQFRPSSKMTIKLFRHNINPIRFRRPHLIGQHTCDITQLFENDSELELTDESAGHSIPIRLIIKLTIIPDLAKDVMTRVDADVAAAGLDNTMLANTAEHIDEAIAISRIGGDAVKLLGPCVEPLGNALKLFVKVMDSVADAHPIVKASWTVLSAAYKAVQAQMIQDENVVSLAESLREMLGIAQEVPDLTVVKGTTDVIEEIGRVSLEVASLIDENTRHSFAVRTAKSQITDMKTRIDKCQQTCGDLIDKFRTRLGIGAFKGIKTIEDNMLADKISDWLKAPDSSKNYNDAREKQHGSTGSWFIDGDEFPKWKDGSGFLCIYGKAGCGKTVLCSSIIANVLDVCTETKSSACAYFFFDGRDAQSALQRHDGLIRSLIQQFVDQCDSIPSSLAQLYGRGHRQPSTGALEDVLQHVLRGFTKPYIIIDSLDECAERRELLRWISKTASSNTGDLHLLVTSRPEEDIKAHLQSSEPTPITMDEALVASDIKTYIDATMKEGRLSAWPEDVQMRVKDTLMAKAQGMFRWLAMQLEELQDCFDMAELDDQLVRLPKDLDETYSRILARVPEQRRTRTKIILQWTAFSARAPRLEELGEAVGVEFDQDGFPKHNPRRKYQTRDVLATCASLIIESNGHVKLAHFSVKEYLVSDRIADGAAKYFSMSEKLSHSFIAKTSLAYLLHLDSPGLEDEILAAAPLAEYAASNWVFHVRSGEGDGEQVMKKLIAALLESENPIVNWIRLSDPENPRNGMQPRILSTEVAEPLYYASLLGFAAVAQYLLDSGASVNPQRTGGQRASENSSYMRYGNALQVASYEGHRGMVKFLLDKDVNVNILGGKYGCALQAAAWTCDEAMVRLLLERGADVNIQCGEFGCALQAAACRGDNTIVRLLLEWNANVNLQGGRYDTALQAAAFNGHKAINDLLLEKGAMRSSVADLFSLLNAAAAGHQEKVKALLERGVDINMNIGIVGSPLHFASSRGQTGVVKILLENNADVNRRAGLYGNPLQAASFGGYLDIVQLLVENNADVNAQGGSCGNALFAASLYGHDEVVKLLLEHGADVNARTSIQVSLLTKSDPRVLVRGFYEKQGDTDVEENFAYALHAASFYGCTTIVKMLLAHGADVNARGGYYDNALRAALHNGYEDVAKLLLENGATPQPDLQRKND